MTTSTPFSLATEWLDKLAKRMRPPQWLVHETQRRLALLLNHVLMQEPEAQARLARQAGRVVRFQWRGLALQLAATPAGLTELAPEARADLLLTVTQTGLVDLAREMLSGAKPSVRIEGDVQFAAEINWLIDNVRWDAEEDLARLLGDAPAHALSRAARAANDALRAFIDKAASPRGKSAPVASGSGDAGAAADAPDKAGL
ncbi:MAG: hypothetical protein LBP52_08030 [Burkholderiaceae bacterium]|jgi:ubiquinone biosynthesis protein UbiJ|nr:hypothetical protein [Burkholderiaceae bacterium]